MSAPWYFRALAAVQPRSRSNRRRSRRRDGVFSQRRRLFASEQLEARWMLSSDPIVTVDTNYGTFQIELLPSAAPQSVANFLSYVDSGAYTNTIFHRSVQSGIGIDQTGGFTSASGTFTSTSQFQTIPTNAAIPLEYSLPNAVGTVAMARTNDPNSATDQWYINTLDDISTSLGASNGGGYAVFGKVLGNGMQVVNAIAALNVTAADSGTFQTLPLGANNQLVRINSVTVDSIDGTVFNDANSNGTMDSGEAGVAGRTVFLDIDGSGVPNSTNISTTTDASGNYKFSGLTAGTYTVREVLPSGVTLSTGTHTITVAADQTATSVNFGETVAPGSTGSIYGTVFNDVNVNGKLDAGEHGLAGRTVFLNIDGTGVADSNNPSTTTDASGNYSFTGLAPGSYTVMESISSYHGVTLTTSTQTITLTAGLSKTGVNFGNVLTSTILPIQVTTTGPVASTDPNTAYINAVFQSILGHAPDPTGLAYWQQQMTAGASRSNGGGDRVGFRGTPRTAGRAILSTVPRPLVRSAGQGLLGRRFQLLGDGTGRGRRLRHLARVHVSPLGQYQLYRCAVQRHRAADPRFGRRKPLGEPACRRRPTGGRGLLFHLRTGSKHGAGQLLVFHVPAPPAG